MLGEALLTIGTDANDGRVPRGNAIDVSRRLVDDVRRDRIRLCGMGSHHGGDTIRLAVALRDEDDRLDPSDSLVAAAALACEDCVTLYTNDPILLGCSPLLERAHRKGLTVREAPR